MYGLLSLTSSVNQNLMNTAELWVSGVGQTTGWGIPQRCLLMFLFDATRITSSPHPTHEVPSQREACLAAANEAPGPNIPQLHKWLSPSIPRASQHQKTTRTWRIPSMDKPIEGNPHDFKLCSPESLKWMDPSLNKMVKRSLHDWPKLSKLWPS